MTVVQVESFTVDNTVRMPLTSQHQSAQMSKITNDDLNRMLCSCIHMATVGVKGLIICLSEYYCNRAH